MKTVHEIMLEQKAKGFGDTIETIIEFTGLDKLAPSGCGCKKRKEKLNKMFPYKN